MNRVLTGLVFLFSVQSFASAGFNIQGRILDPSGVPIPSTSVNFKVQIRSSGSENCLLFEETQVLSNIKNGDFSIPVGTGLRSSPSIDGGNTLEQVLSNNNLINLALAPTACATGSSYNPQPTDVRKIVIQFDDGSGVQSLPVFTLNHSPSSNYSNLANTAKNILNFPLNLTGATNGQVLQYNGTQWTPSTPLVLPKATASVNGYLAATDFANFSNKQNTLGYTPLNPSNNLSDVSSISSARTNLGLGNSVSLNVPLSGNAASTELVKGDDSRLTDSRPPNGTAGGDLAGIYPNPTLGNSGVTAGTYNSVTVDTKGRVTGGTTSVSQDLLPNSNGSKNLGSVALNWNALYSNNIYVGYPSGTTSLGSNSVNTLFSNAAVYNITNGYGALTSATTMPSGEQSSITLYKVYNTDPSRPNLGIYTETNLTANSTPTEGVRLETGNKTAGTGNSGNISFQTGTSSGGLRGDINALARSLILGSGTTLAISMQENVANGSVYVMTSTSSPVVVFPSGTTASTLKLYATNTKALNSLVWVTNNSGAVVTVTDSAGTVLYTIPASSGRVLISATSGSPGTWTWLRLN